jgi:hypothetical protein
MSETTRPSSTTAASAAPEIPHRLDDLLALGCPELEALYAQASTPALADVAGDLRGRMLATTVLGGVLGGWPAKLARAWASSERFVWRGKSFAPKTDAEGEGINRVALDRLRLFRFETFIGPSRAGSFDALQLDYDLPSNPFFIRAIKDELRQLRPGLWLGQAYLLARGRETLVLYFGLTER